MNKLLIALCLLVSSSTVLSKNIKYKLTSTTYISKKSKDGKMSFSHKHTSTIFDSIDECAKKGDKLKAENTLNGNLIWYSCRVSKK